MVTSVESIAWGAFYNCSSLTSIDIPNSVTSIKYGAFENCTNLANVTIGNGVTSIEDTAFGDCSSLRSVTIPDSVTSIGYDAFFNCPYITDVTIPKGVSSIGFWAFGYYKNIIEQTEGSVTYTHNPISNFKIKCYVGTAGEQYAIENGFDYELLDTPAHTHSYTSQITKQETCTEAGVETFTCECGDSYTETIKAIGHSYGSWSTTKSATCTADGTKTRKCSACGNTETATIAKTGHSYTAKVVKPTYLADGYTLHTCSKCSNSYKDTPTAKLTLANITKVTFTPAETSVKMSWSKVKDATGYRVYQYNTSTKKWVGVANTTNTYYTFKSLKAGTTYKFTVRAYKTVSGKTVLSPKYSTFTTSTNPATVKFTLTAGSKKATVKWSKVTGATGYIVYYKTSSNGKWTKLKTVNNKTTSYTKTGLTKGKTYYFTVKAYRTVDKKTYNGKYAAKSVKIK